MTDKEILSLSFHAQPGAIAGKEDVGAACTQNAVAVSVHFKQVLSTMETRNFLFVSNFVIIRVGDHVFAAVMKNFEQFGRFEAVFGIKMQPVLLYRTPYLGSR